MYCKYCDRAVFDAGLHLVLSVDCSKRYTKELIQGDIKGVGSILKN